MIGSLQVVMQANRLDRRDRAILSDDLNRMQDFRVRHDDFGARDVEGVYHREREQRFRGNDWRSSSCTFGKIWIMWMPILSPSVVMKPGWGAPSLRSTNCNRSWRRGIYDERELNWTKPFGALVNGGEFQSAWGPEIAMYSPMTRRGCANSACATSNSARVRGKDGSGQAAIFLTAAPPGSILESVPRIFAGCCRSLALRQRGLIPLSLSQLDTLPRIRHCPVLREGISVPFESRFARTFTAVNIEREAPAASGVYGISNAKNWIFIEETENIRASLMDYLANPSGSAADSPSGFSFELSPAYSRTARRDRLIAELAPLQTQGVAAAPAVARRRSRG